MPGLLDALSGGLGYAGDVLEKFGSREAKGLLGGRPRELLSAIPFSDSLGITDPRDRVSGSDLATKWGLARPDDPFGQVAAGFGIDVATDPLTWLGGAGLGRHAMRGMAPAAEEASRFGKLRELREPTALLKRFGSPEERLVGARGFRKAFSDYSPDEALKGRIREVAKEMDEGVPAEMSALGGVVPPWDPHGGGIGFAKDPWVVGHEAMHGMVQNAAAEGGEGALPFLGRQAAREYRASGFSNKGWEAGLGTILDELNSAGIDARKTVGYGRGALTAALSPEFHHAYHNQFSAASPAMAGLFHAAPGIAPGALLGAGAGGVAGYQQDGGEGALMGALAGGLGGAAVGGGLSHAALAPKGMTKRVAGLGDTAAIRFPRKPDSTEGLRDWVLGVDKDYQQAIRSGDDSIPASRLNSLANAAKVHAYEGGRLGKFGADPLADLEGMQLRDGLAVYSPDSHVIIPNVFQHPDPWFNAGHMQDITRDLSPWSAHNKDYIASHEIGHALHHKEFMDDPENNMFGIFFGGDRLDPRSELSRRLSPGDPGAALDLWDSRWVPEIRRRFDPGSKSYSPYAAKDPGEYVAEQFAKWSSQSVARDNPARVEGVMGPEMLDLYRRLRGPTPPDNYVRELTRLLGGGTSV